MMVFSEMGATISGEKTIGLFKTDKSMGQICIEIKKKKN